jgi:hypothetical protein
MFPSETVRTPDYTETSILTVLEANRDCRISTVLL